MAATVGPMDQAELRRQIVAIQCDASLSEADKAKRRQALLSGAWKQPTADGKADGETSFGLCNADGRISAINLAKDNFQGQNLPVLVSECLKCISAEGNRFFQVRNKVSHAAGPANKENAESPKEKQKGTIFDESLKCTMCMDLCNRPVTVTIQPSLSRCPLL